MQSRYTEPRKYRSSRSLNGRRGKLFTSKVDMIPELLSGLAKLCLQLPLQPFHAKLRPAPRNVLEQLVHETHCPTVSCLERIVAIISKTGDNLWALYRAIQAKVPQPIEPTEPTEPPGFADD
jgi:hypothetical protein